VDVGGGFGGLHRSTGWRAQSHGQLAVSLGALKVQVRLELPEGEGGTHIPLLAGLRVPIG
jgi:hypothetical protein